MRHLRPWLVPLLLLCLASGGAEAYRRRRPCASNGMSCEPGPCCQGTRCDDGVCKKPEKEWSDGPKPGEWTPDHPRPLKKDEPKKP